MTQWADMQRILSGIHNELFHGAAFVDEYHGKQIPEGSRVIAIADAYDAMRSCRPYRDAMGFEQCIDEIRQYAGTQFDPTWVDVFVELARTGSID